jgi:hypothetical protein
VRSRTLDTADIVRDACSQQLSRCNLIRMNQQPETPPDERIEQSYSFSKDKIGRELGYPLKRSLLDSALHSASVYAAVYSVRYLGHRHSNNIVLDASFVPEWQGHPTVRGRCLITLWAVPSQQRYAAEQLLVAECLPCLCRWLAKTQSEGNVWRGSEHTLSFEIQDGELRHSDSSSR